MDKELIKARLPNTIKVIQDADGLFVAVYASVDTNVRDGITLPRCSYSVKHKNRKVALDTVLDSLACNEFKYEEKDNRFVRNIKNYGDII